MAAKELGSGCLIASNHSRLSSKSFSSACEVNGSFSTNLCGLCFRQDDINYLFSVNEGNNVFFMKHSLLDSQ